MSMGIFNIPEFFPGRTLMYVHDFDGVSHARLS